ncbi:transcriptional regulator [Flagellimonas abyssi]|uniref:Transcriptional regulator n=1 Tax=Flagellimonas abyssi TaxID=2864871 RepID=A0ABS7EME5_9FLAO|nr:transcriptional regulator [Allomuricauda abyssi]MBW8198763.1 transcriptional regulator [Allomuricauda abyssi]
MEKSKEEIVETIGLHLEEEHNLPPLAARIYAILILTDKDGLTFDSCLDRLSASKSSISTSINLLVNMGLVTYFTKSGDRKRYFKTAKKKTFFLSKLQENLKRIESEKHIITLVMGYHEQYCPKKFEEGQVRTRVYLDYVNETEKTLKKSIKKLESILNE